MFSIFEDAGPKQATQKRLQAVILSEGVALDGPG
jgi:hypothetical protein